MRSLGKRGKIKGIFCSDTHIPSEILMHEFGEKKRGKFGIDFFFFKPL